MKLLLFPLLSSICILPVSGILNTTEKPITANHCLVNSEASKINFQAAAGAEYGKMSVVEFKNQDFCRAELEDFDFDARFTVVSATVYFSGTNFNDVQKGAINSSSLKPIKDLMKRCGAGSRVVFDDIKVKGPDNAVRTIRGISLLLY